MSGIAVIDEIDCVDGVQVERTSSGRIRYLKIDKTSDTQTGLIFENVEDVAIEPALLPAFIRLCDAQTYISNIDPDIGSRPDYDDEDEVWIPSHQVRERVIHALRAWADLK